MDERLMQMVRLSDALIGADAATARRELHARSYSMTPLGPRLGLVQWVDHTIPLFQARMPLTAFVRVSAARGYGAGSVICALLCSIAMCRTQGKHRWAADVSCLAAAARREGQQPWALAGGNWGGCVSRAGCHHPQCHRRLLLASQCRLGGTLMATWRHTHSAHEKDGFPGVAEAVRFDFRRRWPHCPPAPGLYIFLYLAHRVAACS